MGLMANAGMSPKPTEAPGSNGIPKELLRRQNHNYVFPPPDNWCGFINGAYSQYLAPRGYPLLLIDSIGNPLSCSADYTCVNSGAALGCCTATTGTCDNIWTACIDYGNVCDSNCQGDVSIKRWLVAVTSTNRDDVYVLTPLCAQQFRASLLRDVLILWGHLPLQLSVHRRLHPRERRVSKRLLLHCYREHDSRCQLRFVLSFPDRYANYCDQGTHLAGLHQLEPK